jgi:hypothetical protein
MNRSAFDAIPVTWIGTAAGCLYLFCMILWQGTAQGIDHGWAPKLVAIVAEGSIHLSEIHYWIAGTLIGAGFTFASITILRGLGASLAWIALIGIFLVSAIQWNFLGEHFAGALDDFQKKGVLFAATVSTPTYLLLVAKPLLLGAAAVAVAIHLILSLFDADHSIWRADRSGSGPDSRLLEMGAGLGVLVLIVGYMFGGQVTAIVTGPPTAESIIAELQPPLNGKPLLGEPGGREALRDDVKRIGFQVDATRKDPCDRRQRSWLRTNFESYFYRIRLTEDWKPGQPLSSFSQDVVVDAARTSLIKGYVTWDELAPYVLIHLNESELAQRSRDARAALGCS